MYRAECRAGRLRGPMPNFHWAAMRDAAHENAADAPHKLFPHLHFSISYPKLMAALTKPGWRLKLRAD